MPADVVAKRAANALITDAEAKLPRVAPRIGQVEGALDRFKSAHGGLWVGGRVILTTEFVCFHPNAVNRGLHDGPLDIEIPVSDIVSIEVLPAFFSSVISIRTQQSSVKIRCFRAAVLAGQIAHTAGVPLLKQEDGRFRMRLSGE